MKSAKESKRFFMLGRQMICPICGWTLKQAASNNDKKRDIVCECPQIIQFFPVVDRN